MRVAVCVGRDVVLSIGKLGFGQESYYLDTVASGAEDYYVGRGETPGRWLGTMARELGLDGRVDADALREVLAGRDPSTGEPLAQARQRRVPGFDLTFRAPKSVSVLWGLGDLKISREVRAAHEVSVDAALGYLEREACWSRRGTNGIVALRGEGFVGAGFRHRTSRAGDPHLHTHVLVANGTRSGDGRWGALDGRHIYLQAKTAGYLYEAHLRAELTERLGVAWGPVVHGIGDVDGIPEPVLKLFSTRRREIEGEMATRGVTSARAAQYAVLDTRQAKAYKVEPSALRARWAEQVAETGWDHEQLGGVVGQACRVPLGAELIGEIRDQLVGPEGLTRRASTFDRRAVIQAWCDHLPAGADIATIETLAHQTLADPRVVPLAPADHALVGSMRHQTTGKAIDTPSTGTRYSTHELLALESHLVDRAVSYTDHRLAIAHDDHLLAALGARPSLSDEQVELVATLTTSGRPVDVVIAAAGTGKTFSLDAARDAWQRSGHHVIGTALAARAAAELEATAGIPSRTIASFLIELDDREHGWLRPGTVLIVDEAGMVGTRQLARVLDHAATAHAKVVLVGDPRQLPEIDAGGLLCGLGRRIQPLRLVQNRRQHDAWERNALTQLRSGKVEDAIASYHAHGRIHTLDTAPAARDAMCADWWAATLAGDHTLMLATRWSDVDDLNARARARLDVAGRLTGVTLTIEDRPFQVGDRIMTLRNDRRLHVRNGTCGHITGIDADQRALSVLTDAGVAMNLPTRYLDAGHVRHAYATTIHKAQGQTVDRTFVLGSDLLYQEAGYVALSRGRTGNRIYLVGHEPREEAHTPEAAAPAPLDALTQSLGVSHAQHLALDAGIDRTAIGRELHALVHERDRLQEVARGRPPDRSHEIASLTTERSATIQRLEYDRRELAAIKRQRGWRHRDDRRTQQVVLTNRVRHLEPRVADLADALECAREGQREHRDFVGQHGEGLRRLSVVERTIEARIGQLVDADLTDPPPYLRSLGPKPSDGSQVFDWERAAEYVERYRARHDITDPHLPLGPEPAIGKQWWRRDMRQLADLAEHARTAAHERDADLGLGL
jgi:Ti-type conjugative transfer relaxase TraA